MGPEEQETGGANDSVALAAVVPFRKKHAEKETGRVKEKSIKTKKGRFYYHSRHSENLPLFNLSSLFLSSTGTQRATYIKRRHLSHFSRRIRKYRYIYIPSGIAVCVGANTRFIQSGGKYSGGDENAGPVSRVNITVRKAITHPSAHKRANVGTSRQTSRHQAFERKERRSKINKKGRMRIRKENQTHIQVHTYLKCLNRN